MSKARGRVVIRNGIVSEGIEDGGERLPCPLLIGNRIRSRRTPDGMERDLDRPSLSDKPEWEHTARRMSAIIAMVYQHAWDFRHAFQFLRRGSR